MPSMTLSDCETRARRPRFHLSFPTVFLAAALLWLPSAQATGGGQIPGFANLLDAVVRIDVWQINYADGSRRTNRSVGSGVIMTEDGHVITNAHVVSPKAERIRVTLSNLERVEAELVGWDHWTDLAVIRLDMKTVEDRGWHFAHADFGDSTLLVPGQTVFAVGTPNGLSRTVTRGIISNTNRYFEGSLGFGGYETGHFNTWLQTDAAINPGNSGGPLVDTNGAVIGINTRGYLGANNLGFAVPGNIAHEIMHRLIENGRVTRSYVGIVPGPLQDLEAFFNLEVNQGVLVNSVDPGSPANETGMLPGDIILEIGGTPVDGRFPEQLPPIRRLIAEAPVGSTVDFLVIRSGETIPFAVVTEELESRVGDEFAFEDWGLSVRDVSRAIARERQLESESGVMIIGTQPAFPAFRAGIRPGDIITRVNQKTLNNLNELQEIYDNYLENPGKVLLEITRNHQVSYRVLQPED